MKKIYVDYNSTTPIDPRVLDHMSPYLNDLYGNPSSIHSYGSSAKAALDNAREQLANLINSKTNEIIFTTGGTESNNFAIKGAAFYNKEKGNHLITTQVEHASCLESFSFLEKQGYNVTYLKVNRDGIIDLNELEDSISDNTILISCIYANNETGVISPIEQIGQIANERNITFHTDAVQALGKIDIDVINLPVDLASFSSHKLYGPKGIGALYIRKGSNIETLIHGGGQERGRRSGTENVPNIVGFGKASEIMKEEMENENERIRSLRDILHLEILDNIEHVKLNGHREKRICNTLNMSFDNAEGESMVMNLDLEGIAVSTGSACSEGNVDPSHVLLAMGLTSDEAVSSLRFSLGRFFMEKDIEGIVENLKKVIFRIRNLKV